MKVKDLIAALSKYHENDEVLLTLDVNPEYGSFIESVYPSHTEEGDRVVVISLGATAGPLVDEDFQL